jgi:hypothetical protein
VSAWSRRGTCLAGLGKCCFQTQDAKRRLIHVLTLPSFGL